MLERSRGLPARALAAIAELERGVVAVDGGRLKLEWGELRSRPADQVHDLLWWEDGRLLGYLGLHRFGPSVEITGMVAPAARRRGIATALLEAAHEHGGVGALLVVPGGSAAGHALARRRGGVHDHAEHAMVLRGEPTPGPADPRTALRPAAGRVVVERDGVAVGTLRLTREGRTGGVWGVEVDPAHRGRGIGRDVLRRVCTQLLADGADRVELEVAVDNTAALGLYTSLGFTTVTTEDYYRL